MQGFYIITKHNLSLKFKEIIHPQLFPCPPTTCLHPIPFRMLQCIQKISKRIEYTTTCDMRLQFLLHPLQDFFLFFCSSSCTRESEKSHPITFTIFFSVQKNSSSSASKREKKICNIHKKIGSCCLIRANGLKKM